MRVRPQTLGQASRIAARPGQRVSSIHVYIEIQAKRVERVGAFRAARVPLVVVPDAAEGWLG